MKAISMNNFHTLAKGFRCILEIISLKFDGAHYPEWGFRYIFWSYDNLKLSKKILSLTECARDFQSNALWDTHALLRNLAPTSLASSRSI